MKILIALLCLSSLAFAEAPKDADEALLQGPSCAKFTAALKKRAAEAPPPAGVTGDAAMVALFVKVKLDVPAAEYDTCSAAMIRSLERYRSASILVEAKVTLNSIGTSLASHYIEAEKLCPSTKTPAPAKLDLVAKGPYVATAADWNDPAWTCMGFDHSMLDKQRFQYEVKVTGTKVDLIARGYPTPGKLVTVTKSGVANDGTIKWGEIVVK